MFKGDPTFRNERQAHRIDLELLGMEARSILKSIRTEHLKLSQSNQVAQSDLHYFRARYNYYKLSLLRLDESEKDLLNPVLKGFKEAIQSLERNSFEAENHAPEPTPFLAPVSVKTPEPAEDLAEREARPPQEALQALSQNSELEKAENELRLIQLALRAEASTENNELISEAVSRVLKRLKRCQS